VITDPELAVVGLRETAARGTGNEGLETRPTAPAKLAAERTSVAANRTPAGQDPGRQIYIRAGYEPADDESIDRA